MFLGLRVAAVAWEANRATKRKKNPFLPALLGHCQPFLEKKKQKEESDLCETV